MRVRADATVPRRRRRRRQPATRSRGEWWARGAGRMAQRHMARAAASTLCVQPSTRCAWRAGGPLLHAVAVRIDSAEEEEVRSAVCGIFDTRSRPCMYCTVLYTRVASNPQFTQATAVNQSIPTRVVPSSTAISQLQLPTASPDPAADLPSSPRAQ